MRNNRQSTSACINQKEIKKSIEIARQELGQICDDIFGGKIALNYDGKVCTAVPLDFHRCLSRWPQTSRSSVAIRNTILSCLYSTEVNLGGSGLISCLLWTGRISLDDVKGKKRQGSYALAGDVDEIISSWSRDGMSGTIAKKLIQMGACGSHVSLVEGNHFGTVVKVVSGEEIFGSIDPLFNSRADVPNESGDFYGVAIDGIVESVAQIHKMLDAAGNNGIVIAARGFLPDVSNTLLENWLSGKLKVIPFVISDWGNRNFLDLVESGFECVSYAMGNEIRKARLQRLIKMSIDTDRITYQAVKNTKSKMSVSFGMDLGSLKGISIDRTKTLLALGRFAARSGITKFDVNDCQLTVPHSSVIVGTRAKDSMDNILQSMGGVITSNR
jgi:hypothetical protein